MFNKKCKKLIPLFALLFIFLFLVAAPIKVSSNPNCADPGQKNGTCWKDMTGWWCALAMDEEPLDCHRNIEH